MFIELCLCYKSELQLFFTIFLKLIIVSILPIYSQHFAEQVISMLVCLNFILTFLGSDLAFGGLQSQLGTLVIF